MPFRHFNVLPTFTTLADILIDEGSNLFLMVVFQRQLRHNHDNSRLKTSDALESYNIIVTNRGNNQ